MMLVLVSVVMATILATAYLASRDNSAPISNNIANAASARWAALSGLQTAVAILQTETDWRTNHVNGKLLDNYPLAGALVTVELRDIVLDGPPTSTSENLEVSVTADVAGITQVAVATAFVPLVTPGNALCNDLREFAIFVDDLTMSDQATVTRWPMAPQTALGRRVLIGTQSTSSGSIQLGDSAACLDTTLYYEAGASASMFVNSTATPVDLVALPDEIPMPYAPGPGVTYPSTTSSDLDLDEDVRVYTSNKRYDDVTLLDSQMTLQGNVTFIVEDDSSIEGSTIYIDGNVTMVLFDDVYMTMESSIELLAGAKLAIYFGDEFELHDGYIGDVRPDDVRDNSGTAPAMDLTRIVMYSIDNSDGDSRYLHLSQNSVVKGTIYAPTMDVRIEDDSALYGSVACDDMVMTENAALFYDHALDLRTGYSNTASPLFESDGDIKSTFLTLGQFNPAVLESIAGAMNIQIMAFGETYGPAPADPPPPPPEAPTPRPVPVTFHIVSFGTDMHLAEEAQSNG